MFSHWISRKWHEIIFIGEGKMMGGDVASQTGWECFAYILRFFCNF